jgi:uncharacterized protein YecT (DUF1311 family)
VSPPLRLFRGPRVAARMRTLSHGLILAASLSLLACGPRNQDKLADNELATATGGKEAAPDTRCGARSVQDEVKRQLFARAAEIRGSNAEDYASIAGFALLQLDAVPDISAATGQMAECTGRATLRLPAGLRVAGGRTALSGAIGYSIAPGARGTVTLGQSDSIAIPLATLTQKRAAPPPPAEIEPDPLAPVTEDSSGPAPTDEAPGAAVAHPSFDCGAARSQSEQAVCSDPTLSALDRAMASQYRAAVARADALQARQLSESRDRFLVFRDRCPSEACMDRAYRGRIREIDDIMANRWRGRLYRQN